MFIPVHNKSALLSYYFSGFGFVLSQNPEGTNKHCKCKVNMFFFDSFLLNFMSYNNPEN